MQLKFTKMHALGNDFILLDFYEQSTEITSSQIRELASRNTGVGCDQVLLIEKPQNPSADFRYRIFNADGNEVEQCGNGARCFAKYVLDHEYINKKNMVLEAKAGLMCAELNNDDSISVNMGYPCFKPDLIPFVVEEERSSYSVDILGTPVELAVLSMGNPHAVIIVDNINTAPVEKFGSALQQHPLFPNQVNLSFMQLLSSSQIQLRVYERGVGETYACGSGACAAVVVGNTQGKLENEVTVTQKGGDLMVIWERGSNPVFLKGSATYVYEGEIQI
jgi:diaminopimelate epimerase